jgi:hypothetical protein
MDDAEEIRLMRPNPQFQEHMVRLLTPMQPGFTRICDLNFVIHNHEEEILADMEHALEPRILERARLDAMKGIHSFKALIIDTLEKSTVQYMKTPDMYGGQNFTWNASTEDALETNLSCFIDMNLEIWGDNEHMEYEAVVHNDINLTETECEDILYYVKQTVELSAATIPYAVNMAVDVYYDSADTETDD